VHHREDPAVARLVHHRQPRLAGRVECRGAIFFSPAAAWRRCDDLEEQRDGGGSLGASSAAWGGLRASREAGVAHRGDPPRTELDLPQAAVVGRHLEFMVSIALVDPLTSSGLTPGSWANRSAGLVSAGGRGRPAPVPTAR
jgi:hypothetical protein